MPRAPCAPIWFTPSRNRLPAAPRMRNALPATSVSPLVRLLGLVLLPAALLLQAAPELDAVLSNMNAAAAQWKGMRANAVWTKYVSLVDDKSAESGTIVVQRVNPSRIDMLVEFTEPNHYFLSIKDTKVEIYKPKIATIEVYDLSKSRDKLRQALLLGFGASGKFLRDNYNVSVTGEEAAAGVESVRLELRPKTDEQARSFEKIEMWIAKKTWQPVKQKVYETSPGDYRIYSYSAVESNPKFPRGSFKLKSAPGTSRVFPQR